MKPSIITYAISRDNGLPVYIRNAQNGLACNCICAECGATMIATQGKIKDWHFRHDVESNCSGGFESAIHKLAKQIIVENSQINIPGQTLAYSNARQECALEEFVPDVTVSTNEFDVHFEIVVTNDVELAKSSFYKSQQHKSVRIDLSTISRDISPTDLKGIVLQKTNNKSILFWEAESTPVQSRHDENVVDILLKAGLFVFCLFLLNRIFGGRRA